MSLDLLRKLSSDLYKKDYIFLRNLMSPFSANRKNSTSIFVIKSINLSLKNNAVKVQHPSYRNTMS